MTTAKISDRRHVNGVLLLDKPSGLSSNHALQRAKRVLQAKKAGHTGTLDPLASGLLPLCFGEATKFAGFCLNADKTYVATMRLGTVTTTGDAEGEVTETHDCAHIGEAEVREVMRRFTGPVLQVPPMYSALKHQGRPLYHYALKGEVIERAPRRVEIFELVCMEYRLPDVRFFVRCSKGTYVRTLVEDIGRTLGCGACLSALRRVAAGGFEVTQSVSLDALMAAADPQSLLWPVDSLVSHLPSLSITDNEARRLYHGQTVRLNQPANQAPAPHYRIFLAGDPPQFLGLGQIIGGMMLQSTRLLSVFPHRMPINT